MKAITILVTGALWLAAANGASAQTYSGNYPFCLQHYAPAQFISCSYSSYQQCQISASGRSAQCFQNPYFGPGPAPRRQRRY